MEDRFNPQNAPENKKKGKRGKKVKQDEQLTEEPTEQPTEQPKQTKQKKTTKKQLLTEDDIHKQLNDLDKLEKQLLEYHQELYKNAKYPFLIKTEDEIKLMIARQIIKIRLGKDNDLLKYLE